MAKTAGLSKGRKVYRIVSSIITTVVLLFLCAVALFAIIQRSTDKSPNLFGYYTYTVLTDSMEPTLVPGDVILSKKAVAEELKVQDVVTYKPEHGPLEGHNVTHRIIEVFTLGDKLYVRTQGDNATGADSPIEAEKIESVMIREMDGVSKLLNFFKKPIGFICLIALPLLLLLVLVILSYFRDRLKLEKEQILLDTKEKTKDDENDIKKAEYSDEEITKMLEELKKKQKKDDDA